MHVIIQILLMVKPFYFLASNNDKDIFLFPLSDLHFPRVVLSSQLHCRTFSAHVYMCYTGLVKKFRNTFTGTQSRLLIL